MVQLHSDSSAKAAKAEIKAEEEAVEVAPAVLVPAAAVEQLLLVLVASACDDGCETLYDAVGSPPSAEPAT